MSDTTDELIDYWPGDDEWDQERALADPPQCPYCKRYAVLQTGDFVYPKRPDLAHLRFWICEPCDARVGCHSGSYRPFGTLANAELRRERQAAHGCFDRLWHPESKTKCFTRKQAYAWLAEQLELTREECHIGLFDVETCRRVVNLLAFAPPNPKEQP